MIDEALLMELQARLESNKKAEAIHADDMHQLHKVCCMGQPQEQYWDGSWWRNQFVLGHPSI